MKKREIVEFPSDTGHQVCSCLNLNDSSLRAEVSTGAVLLAPLPIAQETSGKVCTQFGCHSLVGGLVSGFQSVKPEMLLNHPHSQGLTVKNKRLRGSSGPSIPQAPSCLGLARLLLEALPPALLGQLLPIPPTRGHPPRPPPALGPGHTLFTSSSRRSLEVSAASLERRLPHADRAAAP